MSFLGWLKRIGRKNDRFDPSRAAGRIGRCKITQLTEEDINVCCELYRLNERNRFPAGYFKTFKENLQSESHVFLVVKDAAQAVGVGGIWRDVRGEALSYLVFGMVHPDRQGEGFGSALLLARLAALPDPNGFERVFLSAVAGAESFYTQFGFSFFGRFPVDPGKDELELDYYYTVLGSPAWVACGAILEASGVQFDRTEIRVPTKRSAPNEPIEPTRHE